MQISHNPEEQWKGRREHYGAATAWRCTSSPPTQTATEEEADVDNV